MDPPNFPRSFEDNLELPPPEASESKIKICIKGFWRKHQSCFFKFIAYSYGFSFLAYVCFFFIRHESTNDFRKPCIYKDMITENEAQQLFGQLQAERNKMDNLDPLLIFSPLSPPFQDSLFNEFNEAKANFTLLLEEYQFHRGHYKQCFEKNVKEGFASPNGIYQMIAGTYILYVSVLGVLIFHNYLKTKNPKLTSAEREEINGFVQAMLKPCYIHGICWASLFVNSFFMPEKATFFDQFLPEIEV